MDDASEHNIAAGMPRPTSDLRENADLDRQWEYKIVYVSGEKWTSTGFPDDFNEHFDSFGLAGWELVSTEAVIRPGWFYPARTVGIVAFFKRRLFA